MAFRRTLSSESDRGAALMAAAFLDDELGKAIGERVVEDKKSIEILLGTNGSAGSFSTRINLAYLLGIISKCCRTDLNIIRKIRNEFAHNPSEISLSDTPLKNRIESLSWVGDDVSNEPRAKFLRSSLVQLTEIHATHKLGRLPERELKFDRSKRAEVEKDSPAIVQKIKNAIKDGQIDPTDPEELVLALIHFRFLDQPKTI